MDQLREEKRREERVVLGRSPHSVSYDGNLHKSLHNLSTNPNVFSLIGCYSIFPTFLMDRYDENQISTCLIRHTLSRKCGICFREVESFQFLFSLAISYGLYSVRDILPSYNHRFPYHKMVATLSGLPVPITDPGIPDR
jgi:hypothetical protein